MTAVRIATNFNIDIELYAPPFHKRLLAWGIDIIIQIFYFIVAFRFYDWLEQQLGRGSNTSYTMWAIGLILILPFLLYHLIMEVTMNGQSIGKSICGIKVISENGGRPSISQFIIRWLIRTSDYTIIILMVMIPYAEKYGTVIYWGMTGAIVLLLIDIILVNSKKQQRLGDILAHTLLINTAQKGNIDETIFLEVQDNYTPHFPEVMQLSDNDINALKNILDTAKKQNDFQLAAQASEKIKNHLRITSNKEPVDFLEVLLKDYNYLSTN